MAFMTRREKWALGWAERIFVFLMTFVTRKVDSGLDEVNFFV